MIFLILTQKDLLEKVFLLLFALIYDDFFARAHSAKRHAPKVCVLSLSSCYLTRQAYWHWFSFVCAMSLPFLS